jgi:CheY-like chemotaxis protein
VDANGAGPHVLVINDTKEILDVVRLLLEEEGYAVSLDDFSSFDAGAKLADVQRLAPDAVVLDFLVGGEALGWQLLQLLRLDPATRGIPIVVCTAAVRQVEELGAHLRTMGVEVVLKPFEIEHLLAALARALHPAGRPDTPGTPPSPEPPGNEGPPARPD